MNEEMQAQEVQEVDAQQDMTESNVQAPEPALPQLGAMLIEAREHYNLSAADLARQLRLALRQVNALEENRFDDLPGNTFVRGFIRNYARAVQTDAEPLLAAYERSRPQPVPVEVTRPTEAIAFPSKGTPKWVWYLGGVVLLLVLAPVLIYLVLQDDGSATVPHKKAAPVAVSPSVPANTRAPLDLPMPQAVPQNTVPEPGSAQAPANAASPVLLPPVVNQTPAVIPAAPPAAATSSAATQQNVPATSIAPAKPSAVPITATTPFSTPSPPKEIPQKAGERKITLTFDGDAWVEIRDRSGKIVFSKLSRRGEVQVVQGTPPFNVVAGNAGQVRITYNDKPFDMTQHTKVNVARFKLE